MDFSKLKPERIYCFPNRFGWVAFGLFLVALATAGTYQNNLIFMMSFLLLSLGLIAILQTARNLRDITLLNVHVKPVISGEQTEVVITLKNPTDTVKLNIKASFQWEGGGITAETTEVLSGDIHRISTPMVLNQKRGIYKLKRVKISTQYPYSLFNAWKWLRTDEEIFVYPKPIGRDFPTQFISTNNEDFSGHKKYEDGDPHARIDWKVFSKTNNLFIREFKDSSVQKASILWSDATQTNLEEKVSQMSLWIHQAHEAGIHYDVQLPGFKSETQSGPQHFHKCMSALTRMT